MQTFNLRSLFSLRAAKGNLNLWRLIYDIVKTIGKHVNGSDLCIPSVIPILTYILVVKKAQFSSMTNFEFTLHYLKCSLFGRFLSHAFISFPGSLQLIDKSFVNFLTSMKVDKILSLDALEFS